MYYQTRLISPKKHVKHITPRVQNQRIHHMEILTTPHQLVQSMPLTPEMEQVVFNTRDSIEKVLHGEDSRLVVIVGPCSIHDYNSAIEYAQVLAKMIKKYKDKLIIVMRTYFAKPRTTVGWKGYIYDPDLDGSCNVNEGLTKARKLLLNILALGVPCAMEHLDSIAPQYFGDALSWAAIGARTTESQVHRELASGISTPIGFKNGTGGSIDMAIHGIQASRQPQRFFGCNQHGQITAIETTGNPNCHIILRGSDHGPNYSPEHVQDTKQKLIANQLPPNIFIDMSHGNSQKKHKNQITVCTSVADQIASGVTCIKGVMIESHLIEGKQDITQTPLVYGQSVTDACVNVEDTERMLEYIFSRI
jgi:3-deoxy-7-phosphoheptulonate synthase